MSSAPSGGSETDAYSAFLRTKRVAHQPTGKEVPAGAIHPALFSFQRDATRWAIAKGRSAVLLDAGLGKTFVQLEWARLTGERTLILAPLSVARQTVREARKIDLEVRYVRSQAEVTGDHKFWITNYEMLDAFVPAAFGAVVLDESSILKAMAGRIRARLTAAFAQTPYRLCCSATPAPNDYTELGNHAQFLGVCTQAEMLAMFFINANRQEAIVVGDRIIERKGTNKGGQEWRLKHHAEGAFFRWLASWATTMTKPSDLGYEDEGFVLPPLNVKPLFVRGEHTAEGELLFSGLHGLGHEADVRRASLPARLDALKGIVGEGADQWIIWVGLDEEGEAVRRAFPQAIEVKGSDTPERKAQAFEDFQDGKFNLLVTKGKIGGLGMNFQCAHRMAFLGMNHSWETYYQAVRREWRYGQQHPVDVHVILSDAEAGIYQNVMRKDALAQRLREKLIDAVREHEKSELGVTQSLEQPYQEGETNGKGWRLLLGDSCKRMGEIASDSVDLSVYSPPFADLYTYSASDRDLGNSRGAEQAHLPLASPASPAPQAGAEPADVQAGPIPEAPAESKSPGEVGAEPSPEQSAGGSLNAEALVVQAAAVTEPTVNGHASPPEPALPRTRLVLIAAALAGDDGPWSATGKA